MNQSVTSYMNKMLKDRFNEISTEIKMMLHLHGEKYCYESGLTQTWIDEIELIEFAIQRADGREENINGHCLWTTMKYCRCTVEFDEAGFQIKDIRDDCPIHGKHEYKGNE